MKIKLLLILLCAALLLVGCNKGDPETPGGDETPGESVTVDFATDDSEMFTERDKSATYDAASSVQITLNGDSATAASNAVTVNGETVIITAEGTYVVTGSLTNGQLVVNAPDTAKVQVVLDGVAIHSEASAPLYVLGGDKVFLTLKEGTQSSLSNGGRFVAVDENNIDGALFSKQDLTVNGAGALTVTSPAGHGIVCKDDLVITGGTITISAAFHAIDANDSVRLTEAAITAEAGKDAIHAENTEDATLGFVYISGGSLTATAGGDGIDAGAFLQIEGGELNMTAGGGSKASVSSSDSSMKGAKATSGILINSGSVKINSADDAIHSNTSVTVNGGGFELATGDDGMHADETLTITAGTIRITESYEGLEALDIAIMGGDIILTADDDGLNAAGGTDQSGFGGSMGGGDMFGGPGGKHGQNGGRGGGMGGGMSSSNGSIVISGGTLRVKASGDGLDANGTLEIKGGYVTVCGPTLGDTATLDYDVSGTITGGTFIGTGASGMAQTFSDSEQGVFAVQVGTQAAGTTFVLTDEDGNVVIDYTPELSYAVVILSTPDMVKGESYTITIGELTGTFEAS